MSNEKEEQEGTPLERSASENLIVHKAEAVVVPEDTITPVPQSIESITLLKGSENACGEWCWTASTAVNSFVYGPDWYAVTQYPATETFIYLGSHSQPGTKDFHFPFCLNPVDHPAGGYRIMANMYRWSPFAPGWKIERNWSEDTLQYNPQVDAKLVYSLDGHAEYSIGQMPCDSPLMITPQNQECVLQYRVRVKRLHDGQEAGPDTWLTPWLTGPVPDIDLRWLAANNGYDFVPGQCYKIDIFGKHLINGTNYYSVGKQFCLDC